MSKPRQSLGTRFMLALIVLSVGVLLLTAVATVLIGRANSRKTAISNVKAKVTTIADKLVTIVDSRSGGVTVTTAPAGGLTTTTPAGRAGRQEIVSLLGLFETLPAFDSGIVAVSNDNQIVSLGEQFPTLQTRLDNAGVEKSLGLPPTDIVNALNPKRLRNGDQQFGSVNAVAFVAQPVRTRNYGEIVVVVTQPYESRLFGNNGGLLFLVGLVAILIAVVLAFFLARRLTRPIASMQATATQLASGDLSARVDLGRHPDDELAGLARALNGMAAQLGYAKNLERSFLLSVSHDLRTPLTSIAGYAEALGDGTLVTAEEQHRAAEVIRAEARRLERLVADLLDLARLDAHEFSATPRPFDAALVVHDAAEAFRPQSRDLALELVVTTPPAVAADTDPERVAQIIANLVENALKYATTRVAVTLAVTDAELQVTVDDDGPGILPADLPRVFDRLYTARSTPGRKVGTGLGLAIVRELSTALGGTVAVAPGPQSLGSRFGVSLPRVMTRPPPPPPG
jgi:signal transduction histidine kinase